MFFNKNWRGRLCSLDLLIKLACFVKNDKYNFIYQKQQIISSWYKDVNGSKSSPSVISPCPVILFRLISSTKRQSAKCFLTKSRRTYRAPASKVDRIIYQPSKHVRFTSPSVCPPSRDGDYFVINRPVDLGPNSIKERAINRFNGRKMKLKTRESFAKKGFLIIFAKYFNF